VVVEELVLDMEVLVVLLRGEVKQVLTLHLLLQVVKLTQVVVEVEGDTLEALVHELVAMVEVA
tara:strand:- start:167 stop:355 length:189 start_codon:yes stop_codon:yes gene_type:complete